MSNIAAYKYELKKLRDELKDLRVMNRVAEVAGVTPAIVTRVLKGVYVNQQVLAAARQVLEQAREERRISLEEKATAALSIIKPATA